MGSCSHKVLHRLVCRQRGVHSTARGVNTGFQRGSIVNPRGYGLGAPPQGALRDADPWNPREPLFLDQLATRADDRDRAEGCVWHRCCLHVLESSMLPPYEALPSGIDAAPRAVDAARRIVIVHGPTADAKHGTSDANVT